MVDGSILTAKNIDILSAVVFLILMGLFLYRNKEKLSIQRLISLPQSMQNIPIIYALLLRTRWGLGLMDRMANKYREHIKLFGYCSVGIGFLGMLLITFMVLFSFGLLIFRPDIQNGAALLIPFTNIPGLGYLSFWHFIISLFIIITVHEFAHGVVARAHNIKVSSSGVGALSVVAPILPLAFVEPDEQELKKREDIIQYSVFSAGPVINIVIGILLFILFSYTFVPIEASLIEPTGFSFDLINDSYPAAQAGLNHSNITTLNGENIDSFIDFQRKMICIGPDEEIEIGTSIGDFTVVTTESPDNPEQGFIGIRPIQNEMRVKAQYQKISGTFFWFKDLFKWLFTLNIFVGLFNLLPMAIVDGGRMFQIAINKMVGDNEKGNRIVIYIALLFVAIMLIMLARTYLPGLTSLVFG